MDNRVSNYRSRLIDEKINLYLQIFKAIQIVGPKWCGKTRTSIHHANSIVRLTDPKSKELAKLNPQFILNEKIPEVIDERQLVPEIWDVIRNECDIRTTRGNFILTGSTSLLSNKEKELINHTGTGRIIKLQMFPMSNYELGNSKDCISLRDMFECKEINKINVPINILDLSRLIINGGWPENINLNIKESDGLLPKEYINSIIKNDINEKNNDSTFSFSEEKMRLLLNSLARNESTYASDSTILKDAFEFSDNNDLTFNRRTLIRYLDILDKLYITDNIKPFSTNYRSSSRVGKNKKLHFVDPSLPAALLNLTPEKLINVLNTFGLLFESLVIRDLRIYMEYYRGNVYVFRDNLSGDEVDVIVELEDGEYGAIEIKLGQNEVKEAIKSLTKFNSKVEKKPKFLCVIVGIGYGLTKDKESGVYIVPYDTLGMHFEK